MLNTCYNCTMKKSSAVQLKHKTIEICLYISGIFLVPILTLYLGSFSNPLITNFTFLANQDSTSLLFMIWSIITILTECSLLLSIFKKLEIKNPITLLYLAFAMFIAIIIPYPKGDSFLGFLHVLCSYGAFIFFNLCLYQIYFKLKIIFPHLEKAVINYYFLLLGICISIFLMYGSINGLMEIIYCIGITLLLVYIKTKAA